MCKAVMGTLYCGFLLYLNTGYVLDLVYESYELHLPVTTAILARLT